MGEARDHTGAAFSSSRIMIAREVLFGGQDDQHADRLHEALLHFDNWEGLAPYSDERNYLKCIPDTVIFLINGSELHGAERTHQTL
jgi:hypothetical protein